VATTRPCRNRGAADRREHKAVAAERVKNGRVGGSVRRGTSPPAPLSTVPLPTKTKVRRHPAAAAGLRGEVVQIFCRFPSPARLENSAGFAVVGQAAGPPPRWWWLIRPPLRLRTKESRRASGTRWTPAVRSDVRTSEPVQIEAHVRGELFDRALQASPRDGGTPARRGLLTWSASRRGAHRQVMARPHDDLADQQQSLPSAPPMTSASPLLHRSAAWRGHDGASISSVRTALCHRPPTRRPSPVPSFRGPGPAVGR